MLTVHQIHVAGKVCASIADARKKVPSGPSASDHLGGMLLRRRAHDHCIDIDAGERMFEFGRAARAPYLAATAEAFSPVRMMIETVSKPPMFQRPSRCFSPNAPAPARAILT